ncbi:MAG: flavin reductase family protein [Chloroflexota bacterium]|jgi:flavin reductase (DIM6/NTAB) family NADH-FMN oxidoreductase RutF|nr:flavin reductase family protein [Chloroflexota bacterium]
MKKETINENTKPEELKQAMRSWITGVAIVTGYHEEKIHGMTANSFNSLALSPPTVLVALRQHTRTRHLVMEGGVFGVSILNTHQIDIAKRFAGQIDQDQPRFENVDTFSLVTGAPLIKDSLAFLDCSVVNSVEVGETTVFFGKVLAVKINGDNPDPLLYVNREWRKLG